ncbi:MAG TPA: transposase [Bacteriovoracaceae bacterium]|nr:transposase [Bacteriovoracaceae bacterium]
MPRPLLIKCDTHPYHVTSRCNNKEFFPLPMSEVWNIMIPQLLKVQKEHKLAIHAFVLMSNHFHLLCHTPEANLDQAMHSLLRNTSVIISKRAQTMNHLWGGRYRWSLITSQTHYFQVYRYIFQNPVRAGIVSRVEDYQFSTLRAEVPFPLHSSVPMTFGGGEGEIIWLNEKFDSEDLELIQKGLRKGQFDVNRKKFKAFSRLSIPTIR